MGQYYRLHTLATYPSWTHAFVDARCPDHGCPLTGWRDLGSGMEEAHCPYEWDICTRYFALRATAWALQTIGEPGAALAGGTP